MQSLGRDAGGGTLFLSLSTLSPSPAFYTASLLGVVGVQINRVTSPRIRPCPSPSPSFEVSSTPKVVLLQK